jgi:hypothetical protein
MKISPNSCFVTHIWYMSLLDYSWILFHIQQNGCPIYLLLVKCVLHSRFCWYFAQYPHTEDIFGFVPKSVFA